MRLVEFTTEKGRTFSIDPQGLRVWQRERPVDPVRLQYGNIGTYINCTYQEAVDKINAALEPERVQPDLETIEVICVVTNCSLTVTGDGFEVQERGDNA